ncbi:MAG: hypothetical protein U9Q74_03985 [Gemmatimonadota bacterium]|nr:hypothetical protein [Gemmatimonadota bacterium]
MITHAQVKAAAPPAPIAPQVAGTPVASGDPVLVYRALRDQREILGDQLRDLQNMRNDLVSQLGQNNQSAATKAALEKRIANVDERIADLDKQVAASDRAVAEAAAVPGATVRPPDVRRDRPDPDMMAGLSFLLIFTVAIPVTIAYTRRIWRRSARAEAALPPEMTERMAHLERGVEAIALEVERIGEGQRFLTQAMVDRGAVPAIGAAGHEHDEPRRR